MTTFFVVVTRSKSNPNRIYKSHWISMWQAEKHMEICDREVYDVWIEEENV